MLPGNIIPRFSENSSQAACSDNGAAWTYADTMSTPEPKASIDASAGDITGVLNFMKQMRYEFRELRFVRIGRDWVQVFDVNHDSYLIRGLGYPDADSVTVLDAVNAVYKRETLHDPTDQPWKQFKTGRRRTWAVDRVM